MRRSPALREPGAIRSRPSTARSASRCGCSRSADEVAEPVELREFALGRRRRPRASRGGRRPCASSEVERELVAVPCEEAPAAQGVAGSRAPNMCPRTIARRGRAARRVAEPHEHAPAISAPTSSWLRLPSRVRVVVEPPVVAAPGRRTACRGRGGARRAAPAARAGVGRRLDDLEGVLVERELVVAALLVEADRRLELGQELDEHAGVAREPERLRRLRAEEELRELAHPVRREAAADPLARDVPDLRRPLAHLPQRVLVRVETELRDEAQPADDAQRVVPRSSSASSCEGHAARGRRCPPSGSTSSPVARLRAIALIVKSRRRMSSSSEIAGVGDDLEVVPAGPGRALRARRRELDAGGRERRAARSRGTKRTPDLPAGDHQVLDAAVRLERGAELRVADAGDDEVGPCDGQAEQLVADRAADRVGVEAERART